MMSEIVSDYAISHTGDHGTPKIAPDTINTNEMKFKLVKD